MGLDARIENGRRVIEKWDRVFTALSAEPRRQIVVSLLDAPPDRSISLPERAANPNVPTDPERLRCDLLHTHLPMLADLEFVDWEREPFVASRGPQFDEVAVVIDALQTAADDVPESLVIGCQRLEREREEERND
ncbi:hypothetical protein HTZ84_17430 [Haloterrigena sp. SYSU A558-1]|uniref:ArsR family transcriptional regulator n=1 Tax=Haloterrigena gelatinilytica TaxID=2741724 RepID=A0ABX2LF47_9EURY|nr:hypothetical protein [Haloterrigena gelatinilytica]NUC74060.1 hypothetical protein [Haloterrigena gelatinilytica]